MSSTDPLRLDAHQHFWRYDAAGYPWIGRDMACLRRNFTPDDLRPLLDQAGLDGCIAVQAQASTSETDRLLLLAERYPWIRAVVGWVDLCAGDLEQSLERWAQASVLRGFRHQLQDESAPATFMQRPDFNRGLALLQRRGHVYEVLIKARDLGLRLPCVSAMTNTIWCSTTSPNLTCRPTTCANGPSNWHRWPRCRTSVASCRG